MKSTGLKRIVAVVTALGAVAGFALPAAARGGMVTIKGSDTILPLASAWAEAYMKKHPDAMISVTGGGSGVGLAALINGSCDVADASRAASAKEIGQGRDRNVALKATTVAKDGVAVIVNADNPIKGLSIAELGKLYAGATTWKEVGGSRAKVVTIGRDSSSGTYVFFQQTVLGGRRYRSDMISLPSNEAICQSVSQDEGAIGYVGLAFAKSFAAKHKVKLVPINGVMVSDATVSNGSYPLWRPLYCYTNGRPGGTIGDYLKFVTGAEGQSIVEKVGYVAR